MKKHISIFLVFLIILSFLSQIVVNKDKFLTRYDVDYWQARYEKSNWAKGWESKEPLGDAELYAYAGWRQVNGDDPTKINPETPPLGKYFIGLSILFFKNQNFSSLFFGGLLLWVTFLISRMVIQDKAWSLIPVLFLSADGLFRENLMTSMLDLPLAFFSALSFYFLMKAREKRKYYLLLMGALAATAATKTYLVGFGLVGIFFGYTIFLYLVYRYKDVMWYLLSLPVFVLVYLGIYLSYFINGHNLWDFKYYHFWVRYFARVQVTNYSRFEILRILFLGKWKTWWEGSGIINVSVWNPLWTIGSLVSPIMAVLDFKKKNLKVLILFLWIISYLAMYTYGVPYPRYLLPILPAVYIILVYSLNRLLNLKLWQGIKL